jgi:hypothetical protein
MTDKNARFMLAQAANAAERVAALLERWASVDPLEARAVQLEIAASDLAHHADAIREASGITADTDANLAELARNISTR